MGRRLAGTGGPACRAALALLLLCLLAACGGPAAEEAFNDTDVMFAQMGLAQITEGDRVAEIAGSGAVNPEIKAVATELRGQWRTESATLRGWLERWKRPVEADPSAGAHAGHGDLHSLREEDFAGLRALEGADFDRAAVALLLGNLHNAMETIRMEATAGSYPEAVGLATRMSEARQGQIGRLLALAAG
ncbi:DUF305 domain-containing protein [Actinoplanes sp. NEAU-A12]|uniref:DUF305 domain-containing protein n=1 Tax=Actinoplanes sandaracinus TaxID=3045177 RepID=A0ABT6WK54_9ACTN|nr:DUF305 domain-containing protein [Actinoplanes sandaracinus]MDI6100040.1 DUF305 domain-containing protein [Actinoplanes sandaracinus]